MAPRKKQPAAPPAAPAGKRTRTSQQQGIMAALEAQAAAAEQRGAADAVQLVQSRPSDLLSRWLTDQLRSEGDKYLQEWADKCYEARDKKGDAAAAAAGRGSTMKARRAAAAAAASASDTRLDMEALRYLDVFQHLCQQAAAAQAAFDPRELERLALMLRADVVHALGEVSHKAYTLLVAQLRRLPYARVELLEGGPWDGRPVLVVDEHAAWEPLVAAGDAAGLTHRYLFQQFIEEAGHNFWVDHPQEGGRAALWGAPRKEKHHLANPFELIKLCFERAARSADEDFNGDVLLLRYLLELIGGDLEARLQVFSGWADVEDARAQRQRIAMLQFSLMWRVWVDKLPTDQEELLRVLMQLIVGVASEEELQEVEEEQPHEPQDPDGAEAANPCICTPRELAALGARFLNLLLDMLTAADAAGAFCATATHRAHRTNLLLRLYQSLAGLFWKNATDAVCGTNDACRTLLAALCPEHRLRLLSLVAKSHVCKAYYDEEALKRPPVARAKLLLAYVKGGDAGELRGAACADPMVALQCLNQDKSRCIKVFANVSRDTALNNLAVLACGIALAAQAQVVAGQGLGIGEGGEGADDGAAGSSGSGSGSSSRLQQVCAQAGELLRFLAESHRQYCSGEKKDGSLWLSPHSLLDILHAQAAVTALAG